VDCLNINIIGDSSLNMPVKREFDFYMPSLVNFKHIEEQKGLDMEPFKMPLFSKNFAKKTVVLKKYRFITDFLNSNSKGGKALDFGTGFGAFLPILSNNYDEVTAVDAYDDQIQAAKDLVEYFKLENVKVKKVPKENGLLSFRDSEFDLILATDVLEHNRNYESIVLELKRILKSGGVIVISLPREHLLYRMFARKEVERDEERGHVYHNSKGADKMENFVAGNFKMLRFVNVYSFIHVMIMVKPL